MHPLPEYPRPAMRRDSYENLNGLWKYAITQTAEYPAAWDGRILVPYSPETKASGVGRTLQPASGCTTTAPLLPLREKGAGCCCTSARWTMPVRCR